MIYPLGLVPSEIQNMYKINKANPLDNIFIFVYLKTLFVIKRVKYIKKKDSDAETE